MRMDAFKKTANEWMCQLYDFTQGTHGNDFLFGQNGDAIGQGNQGVEIVRHHDDGYIHFTA